MFHMNKTVSLIAFALSAGLSTVAAGSAPDEATVAAKKLGDQSSYSWKTTVEVPDNARFKPGPTEGQTEKGGFTHLTMSFRDTPSEALIKGDKAAVTDQDGDWKLASELENAEGPGRFLGRMLRNFKTPADQAIDLLGTVKDLKKEGDIYSAALTEDGARKQFRFGEPSNPKGSVKIWVKDGMISKMEVKIEGKVDFNGNEFDASRTTTTEISQVGSTKVNAPASARKLLN